MQGNRGRPLASDQLPGRVDRAPLSTRVLQMAKNGQRALGVYSVVSDESGHDVWVDIGCATPHHDGEGFDITLRALPLEARLLLREPLDEPSREQSNGHSEQSLAEQVEAFERAAIQRCLIETGGNITAALERLKLPRRTLNEKMARLGIDRRRLTRSLRQQAAEGADPTQATESHNGRSRTRSEQHSRPATHVAKAEP